MNEPKIKLVDLVQGFLDECLSAEEFDRLQQLLSADPSAADIFTHAVEMDHLLQESLGKEGAASEAASLALASLGIPEPSSAAPDRERDPTPDPREIDQEALNQNAPVEGDAVAPTSPLSFGGNWFGSGRFPLNSPTFLLGSGLLAACVLLAWGIFGGLRPDENRLAEVAPGVSEHNTKVVARVTRVWKPKWVEPSQGVRDWGEVKIGQALELESGKAEVFFETGAQLILEGPIRFEVLGSIQGEVYHGKLVAHVSENARGFSLLSPVGKVVDYGTEFGMHVRPGGDADLVVFEGEVGFQPLLDSESDPSSRLADEMRETRLQAGQGVRIARDGLAERLVAIDSGQFSRGLLKNSVAQSRPPVIQSVEDNIRSPDIEAFYEIVHGGLAEDALAYVDRPYEWNGLTQSGIPEFLIGADYVKTFNVDRSLQTFRITITLSQPADLYVFWEKKTLPPKWLVEGFSDTEHDIGLDFAPVLMRSKLSKGDSWVLSGPETQIGVGPGVEVDKRFAVWRRHIPVPGEVELGPAREGPRALSAEFPHKPLPGSAMYGIAAVASSGSLDDEVTEEK